MTVQRRQFFQSVGAGAAALGGTCAAPALAAPAPVAAPVWPVLKARRLRPGDTLGLFSPANATFEREPMQLAIEAMQALGFKVKVGAHARSRYGQFAGTDAQRASYINDDHPERCLASLLVKRSGLRKKRGSKRWLCLLSGPASSSSRRSWRLRPSLRPCLVGLPSILRSRLCGSALVTRK